MTAARPVRLHAGNRDRIAQAVREAPDGWYVTIQQPTRSLAQNARMWAMLSTFALHWPEHRGITMTPESWKVVFMAAAGHQPSMLPTLDGDGFIAAGYRSSRLTISQMGDLMECITAEAARRGLDIETGECLG